MKNSSQRVSCFWLERARTASGATESAGGADSAWYILRLPPRARPLTCCGACTLTPTSATASAEARRTERMISLGEFSPRWTLGSENSFQLHCTPSQPGCLCVCIVCTRVQKNIDKFLQIHLTHHTLTSWTSQVMLVVKKQLANVGNIMRRGFSPRVGKIP